MSGNSAALVEIPELYLYPLFTLPAWMKSLKLIRASMVSVPCLDLGRLLHLPNSSCLILFD